MEEKTSTAEVRRTRKRKNYPGDPRIPGTKDFGVILSNLMSYRNQLIRINLENEEEIKSLFYKIAEKLKELSFMRSCNVVKTKLKNEKFGQKSVAEVIDIISERWTEGKEIHEKAREKQKK